MRSIARATTIIRMPHSCVPGESAIASTCPVTRVGPVDQLVEVGKRSRRPRLAGGERVECDPDHLLGAIAHLPEAVDELGTRLEVGRELRQLRDRHALIADSLEVDRVVEDGQHQPEVGRDRPLLSEELGDPALDLVIADVDLVVEGDDLVAQLDVLRLEGVECASQSAEHDRSHLLDARLERVQALLVLDPGVHPKRPVT